LKAQSLDKPPQGLSELDQDLRRVTHGTIAAITEDIEQFRFNKAVARIYEFINAIRKDRKGLHDFTRAESLSALTRLIAPFIPHLAEECWLTLGGEGLVYNAPWPTHDESLLASDTLTLPLQVNGKKRGELIINKNADNETVEKMALSDAGVQRHIEGKTVRKVVVVPGRIVNIVAN